ncbi:hypothetical protein D3C87_244720 [compost metagenome]
MNNNTQLFIFKTDIGNLCINCDIYKILDNHNEIHSWSIDLEDVDCVLRVVSDTLTPIGIIDIINQSGHQCSELF